MSINLLPESEERRSAVQRSALIALLGLMVVWVALGAAQLVQTSIVAEQVVERDAVAQQVALIRAQVDSLAVFQQMADDAARGNDLLSYAMVDEVSWAQLLLDLARGVPDSASFTNINGQILDSRIEAGGQDVFVRNEADDIGFFVVDGYTTELFTPGIEEMLRRFGQIDGLFQQYLSSATVDSIGDVDVTRFAAEVRLDDTARTNRYVDGLPRAGQ